MNARFMCACAFVRVIRGADIDTTENCEDVYYAALFIMGFVAIIVYTFFIAIVPVFVSCKHRKRKKPTIVPD